MRYFIEIAYKGTHYAGWQIQENAQSVQAEIEKALCISLREPISITGSGRTDTGVHASQQFAHFDTEQPITYQKIRSWNALLPADITIKNIFRVDDKAHTRFDATERSYQYKIIHEKNPFLKDLATLELAVLQIDKMQEAAQKILLYDDFESFSKVKTNVKNFKCKIKKAHWFYEKDSISGVNLLIFEITANRFLWGMVRAIVGTLLDVGKKKIEISDFEKIIEERNRAKASSAAPPQGLYLSKITYPYPLIKI